MLDATSEVNSEAKNEMRMNSVQLHPVRNSSIMEGIGKES